MTLFNHSISPINVKWTLNRFQHDRSVLSPVPACSNRLISKLHVWSVQSADRIMLLLTESRSQLTVRTNHNAPAHWISFTADCADKPFCSCSLNLAHSWLYGQTIMLLLTESRSPFLVPWSWKSEAIPLPPMGRTACTEPQCLYKGALYLFLPDVQCFPEDDEDRSKHVGVMANCVWNIQGY